MKIKFISILKTATFGLFLTFGLFACDNTSSDHKDDDQTEETHDDEDAEDVVNALHAL